jgi:hypothetical protein
MTAYEGWATLELMGHRTRHGLVREVDYGGGTMLRIEVITTGAPAIELYPYHAIFGVRPCSEDEAHDRAARMRPPRAPGLAQATEAAA